MSQSFTVQEGPRLLAGLGAGPGLLAHRDRFGALPEWSVAEMVDALRTPDLRGRGGAGFPTARKIETVAARRGRPVVVINAAEGEPASYKDAALMRVRPHLVLDGAFLAARALGTREVHLVVAGAVPEQMDLAVRERSERIRVTVHVTEDRFVSGQAQAVLQRLAGHEGLPVTAWVPEAVRGHRGRPTLLCNAETFAQIAARALTAGAPTMLLSHHRPLALPRVLEVPEGSPWADLGIGVDPVLVGGYHGTWVHGTRLAALPIGRDTMADCGVALGAGVVIEIGPQACPVEYTAELTRYLAGESAGRCGPCVRGLPALAAEVAALVVGAATEASVSRLTALVTGRGACAHPDGTARLVSSLLTEYADEVDAHRVGSCRRMAVSA